MILYFLSLSRALLMLDAFVLWVVVAVPVVVALVPGPEAPVFVLPEDMRDQKEGSVETAVVLGVVPRSSESREEL